MKKSIQAVRERIHELVPQLTPINGRDIVVAHPRVWFFVEILKNTIHDIDLDIERLSKGIDITRERKLKDFQKYSFRTKCKKNFFLVNMI